MVIKEFDIRKNLKKTKEKYATRPIFTMINECPFVKDIRIKFIWHSGFSITQARKSIKELHKVAAENNYTPILEISSKSDNPLGIKLSAMNLKITFNGHTMSVESAFQGSKIFEGAGPYHELYELSGKEAKTYKPLKDASASKKLKSFVFFDLEFPLEPKTVFYDWLYLNALLQNEELAKQLLKFKYFSDISFNPQKSFNCQARSAALYVSLYNRYGNELAEKVQNKDNFISLLSENRTTLF